MLRRMFKNQVDVDREWQIQHRARSYPLYQYVNMDHGAWTLCPQAGSSLPVRQHGSQWTLCLQAGYSLRVRQHRSTDKYHGGLLVHRQDPLYQYVNMDHEGRFVDVYHQLKGCDGHEQLRRQEFSDKFKPLMERFMELRKNGGESSESSSTAADCAKSVRRLARREHRRRRKMRKTMRQSDRIQRDEDALCEAMKKELRSCVYNDGQGENITRVKFRRWKQQWREKLQVSGI